MTFTPAHELLLTRGGLVFVEPGSGGAADSLVGAVELDLAELGYVVSSRLRARLATLGGPELTAARAWMLGGLAAALGADVKHEPLFARFPEGVPEDTGELWLRKVLSHYLQESGQPCLFCRQTGTTHVLSPCRHVVCDRCFDGSNYTACPVCERQVDRSSPFFQPTPAARRDFPAERVTFKLLDLGEDVVAATRALWLSFCERKQAMSPVDVAALSVIVRQHEAGVLAWLPAVIPVKENVALIFGALLQLRPHEEILPAARPHLKTATDVLRLLVAYCGADPSLAGQELPLSPAQLKHPGRWHGKMATLIGGVLQAAEKSGGEVWGAC
jgi:hypothetical protein